MSDFNLVDPRGWEYDLQSVYSAYMGHFQLHNIPWYERSWGIFFESFEAFLTFSWPVITVTDCFTGRAHIVTRMTSIGAFLKMIKTRFGETLPVVDNIQHVIPFETAHRHLRTVSDYALYKKLYSTLPAAVLASLKVRARDGEVRAIRDLWNMKDRTFLAIDFEWSERNNSSCLEWGYAAARCSHLEAVGVWPPDPEVNYRRGHYIVTEYVDKLHNKHRPNFPWQYAFGDSQLTPKAKLPQIIQAVISSMVSPDSETVPNTLVLVGHGIGADLRRMEEMKIKIPHNVVVIDVGAFERQLFAAGHRGSMQDPNGKPRSQGSALSLLPLLQSVGIDVQCALHNSGNDAFMALLALQLLLSPDDTKVPAMRGRSIQQTILRNASRSPMQPMISPPLLSPSMYGVMPMASPRMYSPVSPPLLPPRSPYADQDAASVRRRSNDYFPDQPSPGGSRSRMPSGLLPADGRASTSTGRRSSGEIDEATAKLGNMRV